jgi:hypothetical protein
LAVVAKRVLPRELLGVPGTSDGTAVEETEATRNEWLISLECSCYSHDISMIFWDGGVGEMDLFAYTTGKKDL